MANEDHLLICRSYKVLPNAKMNTSHILLALPFLCPSPQPDFKRKKRKRKPKRDRIALQFRQVLVCLTFIHRNIALWRQQVRNVLFRAKSDLSSGM